MLRKVGPIIIGVMFFLVQSLPGAVSASNTPGSKCIRAGITAKSGSSQVRCEWVNSKLVWKSISIPRVNSSAKKAAPTPDPYASDIENELNGFLPIQKTDYSIEYSYNRTTKHFMYLITLYAIINRQDQYSAYVEQLKQFKREALDYVSSHGGNVSKLLIQYLPPQAADL